MRSPTRSVFGIEKGIVVLVGTVVLLSSLAFASPSSAGRGNADKDRGPGGGEKPGDGRTFDFGAYEISAPGAGMDTIHQLESELQSKVEITHFYQAWGGDYADFKRDWIERAASDGRKVLLTWEPWDYRQGAEQPRFALETIVAGDHDAYIRSWAQGLRSYGQPVFLRPMHEMNGDWYPWGGTVNGNSPDLYIQAWRHLHGVFEEEGVTNVRWVWCPLVDDVPAGNRFERYYPGDAYVDVLALDGYNWGNTEPGYGGWRSFRDVFSSAYERITRLGPQPVWIAEVASATEDGNKVRWVDDMFKELDSGFMPRLDALVWFHMLKERDWRATSPQQVTKVFARWLPRF